MRIQIKDKKRGVAKLVKSRMNKMRITINVQNYIQDAAKLLKENDIQMLPVMKT
jgi:predicted transcriptional regulator